jgi:hypothetical protein
MARLHRTDELQLAFPIGESVLEGGHELLDSRSATSPPALAVATLAALVGAVVVWLATAVSSCAGDTRLKTASRRLDRNSPFLCIRCPEHLLLLGMYIFGSDYVTDGGV